MNDRSVSRPVIIASLAQVFREQGYEGASLSRLADAAGLRKASLYYHFPGGKEEMAEAVLHDLLTWFDENLFAILRGPGEPIDRLEFLVSRLDEHFEGGDSIDLFGFMALGATRDRFASYLTDFFSNWIGSLSKCLIEAGLPRELAVQRAADAVMEIEGALCLSRALGDNGPFARVMRRLPRVLLIGDQARAELDSENQEPPDSHVPTGLAVDGSEALPMQETGEGTPDAIDHAFDHWEDDVPDEDALAAMVPDLTAGAPEDDALADAITGMPPLPEGWATVDDQTTDPTSVPPDQGWTGESADDPANPGTGDDS